MSSSTLFDDLVAVEDDLLSSITDGPSGLESFLNRWSKVSDRFKVQLSLNNVDNDLRDLAHAVAGRVADISTLFMNLEHVGNELGSSLRLEIENILDHKCLDASRPTILSHPSDPSLVSAPVDNYPPSSLFRDDHRCVASGRNLVSSSSDSEPSAIPAFIPFAHMWLLKNLHDPYPSNELKASISESSSCPVKSVTSWFTNVRRRVGWNELSRRFFAGSRTDTIDAAYRTYVEPDAKRPLDDAVQNEFLLIKDRVERLYSDKLTKSTLAAELDVIVKDMTDEERLRFDKIKTQAVLEAKRDREAKKLQRIRTRGDHLTSEDMQTHAQNGCLSPRSSPVPSVSLATSTNELTVSDQSVGQKRRFVAFPSSDMSDSLDGTDCRPFKRRSPECSSTKSAFERRTPSLVSSGSISSLSSFEDDHSYASPSTPMGSCSAFDHWLETTSSTVAVTPEASVAPSIIYSRKRCLSDADTHDIPKRPRGLTAGPRLQTVSDPFPFTGSFSDSLLGDDVTKLFDIDYFNLPNQVILGGLDADTPVEVDMFDDWASFIPSRLEERPQHLHTLEGTSSPSPPRIVEPSQSESPIASSATSSHTDNSPPTSTMYNALFIGLESCSRTPDSLVPDGLLAASSAISDLSGQISHTVTADADLPGMDWLNDYINHLPSTSECMHLPTYDIDMSAAFLQSATHSPSAVLAESQAEEKRAKLERLRAHREAARLLEEELLATA